MTIVIESATCGV